MQRRVYRSLDKSNSLFGLNGRYIIYAGAGMGVSLFVAFMFSSATNGLVGIFVFLILTAASYGTALMVQAQYSVRELDKLFCSKSIPDYIHMVPIRFSKMIEAKTIDDEERISEQSN